MYLVLGYNAYRLNDEVTGEIREGISLQIADEPATQGRQIGLNVNKVTAPIESLPDLKHVPGYYDLDFGFRPGKGGKAQLVFKSATYIKPLALDYSVPKAAASNS